MAKTKRIEITQSYLRSVLNYDPNSGIFIWLPRKGNQYSNTGKRAGRVLYKNGLPTYRRIGIDGVYYAEHRLAWLYIHGHEVPEFIDHINGDGLDNRIINLRKASLVQNQANKSKSKANTSGFKGVVFDKRNKTHPWYSSIKIAGKTYRKHFKTKNEAILSYQEAAINEWREYVNFD